jgi:uncharacterized membrane protein
MIATPLRRRGRRSGLASVVVTALATTTLSALARRWGPRRAGVALASTTAAATAVEVLGSRTGVPFGRYAYTGRLRPTVGGVPAIVPLAWFAMGVPARATARAALGRRARPWPGRLLGAACLTAWDLFLDPQMVGEGYWSWRRRGRYRGIPLTNFAGWYVTSVGIMVLLDRAAPTDEAPDAALVGVYGWMAVMQTLGFAAFFGDPLVAVVGGLAMVPPAVAAVRGLRRG